MSPPDKYFEAIREVEDYYSRNQSRGLPPTNPINRAKQINMEGEHTGKSVNYYKVRVSNPTSKTSDPYTAECNDIIEALGMNYAEANVFKSIWRICADRTLGLKKAGNSIIYDAEKCVFFADRVHSQVVSAISASEDNPLNSAEQNQFNPLKETK